MLSNKALDRLANDIRNLNTPANEPVCQKSQAARLDRQQIIANQQLRAALVAREQQTKLKERRRLIHKIKVFLTQAAVV